MERSSHLKRRSKSSSKRFSKAEITGFIAIIGIFHLVGFIGFLIPTMVPFCLIVVPWHLLLMLVIIIINHEPYNARFWLFMIFIYLITFFAEWIGVQTNFLFGNYHYGEVLGIKLGGVPLIIGINWFLLIYSTGVSMKRSRFKKSYTRVLTGALLLVLLDYFMEQSAVKFEYWHWANDSTPFKNYICWFLISAVLLTVFEKLNFKKQNMVAPAFLIAEFLFFMLLRVI